MIVSQISSGQWIALMPMRYVLVNYGKRWVVEAEVRTACWATQSEALANVKLLQKQSKGWPSRKELLAKAKKLNGVASP